MVRRRCLAEPSAALPGAVCLFGGSLGNFDRAADAVTRRLGVHLKGVETLSKADEQTKFLSIYLEDHVAGAAAGSQRAGRLAEAESGSADAETLARFAADVAADLDVLLALMETIGVEPSRLKAGIASIGEKVGALKLNGRVLDRSP